jgi:photosystem II stability/assembly factor-like uncharacterized protein
VIHRASSGSLAAMRRLGLGLLLSLCACPPAPVPPEKREPPKKLETAWVKLETVPYKGKQDDIFFVDEKVGFYVNGAGNIYKSTDGGEHWANVRATPGTYFRTIGFVDAENGFAGNIGPDYFPGVTDATPLYATHDGGGTWSPVSIAGDPVKGLCAIDVLRVPFINAGNLDHRVVIHAAGRVGGPAVLATSTDAGRTWSARDMSGVAGMILDVKFLDARTGFLCAATNREVERSHALILKTTDGGQTWVKKYESTRPYENTWKCAFPSAKVGYATIQSYDENATARYVAKTIDGGETWTELPLVDDAKVREFGIGFLDESLGWVGAVPGAFETRDGGKTWSQVELGKATNKIRVIHPKKGNPFGFAIGVDVYKLTVRAAETNVPRSLHATGTPRRSE